MPSHTHTFAYHEGPATKNTPGILSDFRTTNNNSMLGFIDPSNIVSMGDMIQKVGSSQSHENRSPYLVLNKFISTGYNLTNPSYDFPSLCYYLVPNCSLCPSDPVIYVSLSDFNVSCVLSGLQFSWKFQNKSSNSLFINSSIVLNDQVTVIDSDLVQTPDCIFFFFFFFNSFFFT